MARTTSDTPLLRRVRELVEPIASDLRLDLYDIEQRGGTMRITLDTPPGSPGSVDLDQLALATRLISREFDHEDPIPGKYTLEVTSPGVERSLRTPEHFRREIGKTINVRLADPEDGKRRVQGVLVAADETTATVRELDGDLAEHVIAIDTIDRARTVFEWGPQPKPGGKGAPKKHASGKQPSKKSAPNKHASGKQPSKKSAPNEHASGKQPSKKSAPKPSAATSGASKQKKESS